MLVILTVLTSVMSSSDCLVGFTWASDGSGVVDSSLSVGSMEIVSLSLNVLSSKFTSDFSALSYVFFGRLSMFWKFGFFIS